MKAVYDKEMEEYYEKHPEAKEKKEKKEKKPKKEKKDKKVKEEVVAESDDNGSEESSENIFDKE